MCSSWIGVSCRPLPVFIPSSQCGASYVVTTLVPRAVEVAKSGSKCTKNLC